MDNYDYQYQLKVSAKKNQLTQRVLDACFKNDVFEQALNIKEYLDETEYTVYKGFRIKAEAHSFQYVDESRVPIEYLEEYSEMLELQADCKAWLRIWSNYCDTIIDFEIGLPGGTGEFPEEHMQLKWEEMKQGEAFEEMEVRILSNKLLK